MDVTKGLKPDGILIINTNNQKEQYIDLIKEGQKLCVFDGTSLALEYLKNPIVNTVMLGAMVAATGFVTIESAEIAIERSMTKELSGKNKEALLEAYTRVKEGKSA
ncbi:Pyruvate synthase subunit PorC [bioreactor metagenome]|uniref:Pyruvate synthase subunit PorC n=1 Tax=bioreactor metagenome TaxID=1076179 RepID=A0A645F3W5_9ZZZZ